MMLTDDDVLMELIAQPWAFSREDESDDSIFYAEPRMIEHLDSTAIETVEKIIDSLVVEKSPRILDLMAAVSSHLPRNLNARELVGLGLNTAELEANDRLDRCIIHDLNASTVLPFADCTFDVVLNTVSVQYITKPFEVFADVGRILKPGGLFLVVFSNRSFPTKSVKVWDILTDEERIRLVRQYFDRTERFGPTEMFISMGQPRPEDDKYFRMGIPSDPVFAVFAEKKGGAAGRPRRIAADHRTAVPSRNEIEHRKSLVKRTLKCPYCQHKLHKWRITENPWTTWDHDLHICINDSCPYLIEGWREMYDQGNHGKSYRLVYDAVSDSFITIPIPSLNVIKDSVG